MVHSHVTTSAITIIIVELDKVVIWTPPSFPLSLSLHVWLSDVSFLSFSPYLYFTFKREENGKPQWVQAGPHRGRRRGQVSNHPAVRVSQVHRCIRSIHRYTDFHVPLPFFSFFSLLLLLLTMPHVWVWYLHIITTHVFFLSSFLWAMSYDTNLNTAEDNFRVVRTIDGCECYLDILGSYMNIHPSFLLCPSSSLSSSLLTMLWMTSCQQTQQAKKSFQVWSFFFFFFYILFVLSFLFSDLLHNSNAGWVVWARGWLRAGICYQRCAELWSTRWDTN